MLVGRACAMTPILQVIRRGSSFDNTRLRRRAEGLISNQKGVARFLKGTQKKTRKSEANPNHWKTLRNFDGVATPAGSSIVRFHGKATCHATEEQRHGSMM